VQDKIREEADEFWRWLEQGAHIYVCGDAFRMAKDVEKAILEVISKQGGKDEDDAVEYLNELRETDRYQRDVY
jgi:sulfite reductase (NADPH) flavoprotein alpha-component